jgi:hypothetical protein
MHDIHGLPLTCASPEAAQAYARAVDAQLHAWPGVGPALDDALRAAPDFALAHAQRALLAATYARRAEVSPAIALAREHAAQASEREQSHVAVIALLVSGQSASALDAALTHVQRWPTDALVAATLLGAFGLLAFSGRADHDTVRLALVRQLRPHYPADHAWLLAHLGWACIEAGHVEEGFEHAQRSFALRPANGNIAHVLMHGHFERHDMAAGLAFIDGWMPSYPEQAMLFGHLHWHAGLCEMALERPDAALARLTQQVLRQIDVTPPLVAMTDAASLLWRLRLASRDGLPWARAAAHAEQHFAQGGNVFAELHLAMLAAGQGDRAALDAGRTRLRAAADKGHAGAPVALQWTTGLSAALDGDVAAARAAHEQCSAQAARLGGSHAQRTVVDRTLASMRGGA